MSLTGIDVIFYELDQVNSKFETRITMIAAKLKFRGIDAWGNGAFNASRIGTNGKVKKHHGIDYACEPGLEILCPCIGKVTKLGYPYSYVNQGVNFRYVEIIDLNKLKHRVFYIEPSCKAGDQVTILTVIGKVQNIAKKYSTELKPMVNHIHYEIIDNGQYIDPATRGHE